MSDADKIIAAGRRYLGCTESPRGSNSGPCVHHIQTSTGAFGVAWCGSFCKRAYLDAGVDDDGIITASTFQTVENAKAQGALIPEPIPGCVIVWRPGADGHMEIVEKRTSSHSVLDVGGNVDNMVKESSRDISGAYFIAPKALRVPPPPVFRTVYWWEDPTAKPEAHGPWATHAFMEHAIDLWVAEYGNPGHIRRWKFSMRVNGKLVPRYTFFTGPRKRSPDFLTKGARDRDLKKVAFERPDHILRKRSQRILVN